MTGIEDAQGRVGNHSQRIPASSMQLDGYKPYFVSPSEMATPPDHTAVVTSTNETQSTASTELQFDDGTCDIAVN